MVASKTMSDCLKCKNHFNVIIVAYNFQLKLENVVIHYNSRGVHKNIINSG